MCWMRFQARRQRQRRRRRQRRRLGSDLAPLAATYRDRSEGALWSLLLEMRHCREIVLEIKLYTCGIVKTRDKRRKRNRGETVESTSAKTMV